MNLKIARSVGWRFVSDSVDDVVLGVFRVPFEGIDGVDGRKGAISGRQSASYDEWTGLYGRVASMWCATTQRMVNVSGGVAASNLVGKIGASIKIVI